MRVEHWILAALAAAGVGIYLRATWFLCRLLRVHRALEDIRRMLLKLEAGR
jgi:hypothetical protein